jgi:hypothetical protein
MERKWWSLLAVCLATFMLLLDNTARTYPGCTTSARSSVRESSHWLGHVLEALLPALAQLDVTDFPGGASRRFCNQNLAAARDTGDARGNVDRRAEPVTVALHGRSGVHADPDGGA